MSQELLDWIQRAAKGDAAAMESLLAFHLPAVRAFIRSHMSPQLRARESSSDVVQSVCRELLGKIEQFQYPSDSAFRAWLFTAARRKLSNRARDLERDKRDAARELPGDMRESALAALGATYSRISSPSGHALKNEEIERLESAIDRLSDEHREVLTLAYFAGLSRAEIGAQIGKTDEAVRSMLHRATARLAILMGGVEEG